MTKRRENRALSLVVHKKLLVPHYLDTSQPSMSCDNKDILLI